VKLGNGKPPFLGCHARTEAPRRLGFRSLPDADSNGAN
jgi:hypothetical protein